MLCEKFAQEGANVVVNYVSSKDRAEEVAEKVKSHGGKAAVVQAVSKSFSVAGGDGTHGCSQDIGNIEDTIRLVKESNETLGGLDVIINNAGWTRFSDFTDLNSMSHDEWNKCWSTNVMSHLVLLQQAAPIFNQNPNGGTLIISSSVAVGVVHIL
jgi:NAD(P)-dependent dehydrogenase (short-subunit alcohol dehydrogenase family)